MNSSARPPSLFGVDGPSPALASASALQGQELSMLDLLYDGFVMLFLLKKKQQPNQTEQFLASIRSYLADFERGAKRLELSAEDIHAAKYAFCAVVDEFVLA